MNWLSRGVLGSPQRPVTRENVVAELLMVLDLAPDEDVARETIGSILKRKSFLGDAGGGAELGLLLTRLRVPEPAAGFAGVTFDELVSLVLNSAVT